MTYRKSTVVAKELGISYAQLIGLLRSNKIGPPAKDTSGHYVWEEDDLAAARKALQARRVVKELGPMGPRTEGDMGQCKRMGNE